MTDNINKNMEDATAAENLLSKYKSPLESPGFKFWQAFLDWQRQIDTALVPYHLTQASFSLLAVTAWLSEENYKLTTQRTVRQKVIVEMSSLNKMQVSQLLKKLLRIQLITIEPFELDRREHLVSLTVSGWEVLKKSVVIVEKIDQNLLPEIDLGFVPDNQNLPDE